MVRLVRSEQMALFGLVLLERKLAWFCFRVYRVWWFPWWLTWHLCLHICEKCEMSRLWRTNTRTAESRAVFCLSRIRNYIMKIIVCRKYAESLCPTQSRLDQLSTYTAQENFRQEILKFHTIIHCTHTLEETSDKKFWQFKQAHIMHSYAGEKFWQVLCRCSRKLKLEIILWRNFTNSDERHAFVQGNY